MSLPFTCIEACSFAKDGGVPWVLFGASGSRLMARSSSGALSVWPAETENGDEPADESEGPPEKRVKLSPPVENTANFSCLTLTNDKQYLVAVTAEDKCIRVFQVDSACQLHQLSQRCMARRPCAIAITSDDSTILCADKFGDVYALPLIPSPEYEHIETQPSEENDVTAQKQFVPAASVLTVHSGRNRKVLEEQMKQASKGQSKGKEPLKFKHELLLGHVSMLTDIAYTNVDGRSYIITADRDEHIRISRGAPQAHIIEGFCQGHEAFVSRLCLLNSSLLVSGGGDPYLFVWDWLKGKLLQKIDLRAVVRQFLDAELQTALSQLEDEKEFKIAVSGIWRAPCTPADRINFLVACEGVPALFAFTLDDSIESPQSIPFPGNVLDVTFIRSSQGLCMAVVSVDNVHVRGSTTETRDDEGQRRLHGISCQEDGRWDTEAVGIFDRIVTHDKARNLEATDARTGADNKAIRDILYAFENLRKRPGSED